MRDHPSFLFWWTVIFFSFFSFLSSPPPLLRDNNHLDYSLHYLSPSCPIYLPFTRIHRSVYRSMYYTWKRRTIYVRTRSGIARTREGREGYSCTSLKQPPLRAIGGQDPEGIVRCAPRQNPLPFFPGSRIIDTSRIQPRYTCFKIKSVTCCYKFYKFSFVVVWDKDSINLKIFVLGFYAALETFFFFFFFFLLPSFPLFSPLGFYFFFLSLSKELEEATSRRKSAWKYVERDRRENRER